MSSDITATVSTVCWGWSTQYHRLLCCFKIVDLGLGKISSNTVYMQTENINDL